MRRSMRHELLYSFSCGIMLLFPFGVVRCFAYAPGALDCFVRKLHQLLVVGEELDAPADLAGHFPETIRLRFRRPGLFAGRVYLPASPPFVVAPPIIRHGFGKLAIGCKTVLPNPFISGDLFGAVGCLTLEPVSDACAKQGTQHSNDACVDGFHPESGPPLPVQIQTKPSLRWTGSAF